MNLHWITPTDDVRADSLARIAELDSEQVASDESRQERLSHLALIELLDALDSWEGPEKWVKLDRYNYLSFYAHDPKEFSVVPQVIIKVRHKFHEMRYELPHENRPWKWAVTFVRDDETVNLLLDAFTRCESRRENLVIRRRSNNSNMHEDST